LQFVSGATNTAIHRDDDDDCDGFDDGGGALDDELLGHGAYTECRICFGCER